jgi:hypothetical protein
VGARWAMTYSTLFIAEMAFCASSSLVYRTNPKPLLRPVSRSLTTTWQVVRTTCSTPAYALVPEARGGSGQQGSKKKPHQMRRRRKHTASSTSPNSSNFRLNVSSAVCHARPLVHVSGGWLGRIRVAHPMNSFDILGGFLSNSGAVLSAGTRVSGFPEVKKGNRSAAQGGCACWPVPGGS